MNREQICDKQYKELLGYDKLSHPTAPEFMDILQKYILIGNLDNKIRELINITVLATMQIVLQLKANVKAFLNIGLTPVEIRETIYQVSLFIGFPLIFNAINIVKHLNLK